MSFTFSSNKLTGNPDPSGWVQVHEFTPIAPEALVSKGKLFALISMLPVKGESLPQGQELLISREVLTRFHEYYYNKTGNQFDLIKEAIANIQKDFASPNISLAIIFTIFIGNKVILAGVGEMEAWVIRNNTLARLIPKTSSPITVTGPIKALDTFILGTSAFFSSVTPQLLKSKDFIDQTSPRKGTYGVLTITPNQEKQEIPLTQIPPRKSTPNTPLQEQMPKKVSPLRLAVGSVLDKIISLLPDKKLYVREEMGNPKNFKNRKIATSVGALLLVLLVVCIFFGVNQQKSIQLKSQYEPILISAQHNLDQAQSLKLIDDARARSLILTAKAQIDSLVAKNIKDTRISNLAEKIDESLGNVAGIYRSAPQLFLDLTLLNNSFKGDDLSVSGERMAVLDRAGKRLETIDISTSRADPVAGPDIMPNAIHVATYSDRNFVTASDGIWEIGTQAKNIIKSSWPSDSLIASYTGNIYVLDKASSKIWKYQGDGGEFLDKQNWLAGSVVPDLSNIVSWSVDGNLWLLTKTGEILRFSSGNPINFPLKGLDSSPVPIDIYTNEDSNYIYLLDTQNSRVLVIDKSGNYKAQYIDESIKNATKIGVSEADKKIILLEGSKLFYLDTKHL